MAEVTYLEAIRAGLSEEMARDENVFILGEDVGAFGGAFKVTEGLQKRFGEARVIDTPIAETAIVGAAAGAAHMGLRPVCEMQFIDFLSCAYSILTNYVATARYRARGRSDGDEASSPSMVNASSNCTPSGLIGRTDTALTRSNPGTARIRGSRSLKNCRFGGPPRYRTSGSTTCSGVPY